MKLNLLTASAALVAMLSSAAVAGPVPYPHTGTPNPVIYSFTAANTGEIDAYFAGSGASFDETVGLLVNGVSTGITGLDDHTSSIGDEIDLGSVMAGDVLTFFDNVSSTGDTFYSNPALNSDGGNHVYSTSVTAGQVYAGSPAGTYVGFEDLSFPGSDYNYHDDTFVFTNTATMTSGGVPEPASWALMLIGFAGIGGAIRSARLRNAQTA